MKLEDLSSGSKAKIRVKCDRCSKIKTVVFSNYNRSKTVKEFGFGVYYCFNCSVFIHQSYNKDEFYKELDPIISKNNLRLLSDYNGKNGRVKVLCCNCNYEYETVAVNLLRTKCRKCLGLLRKDNETFKLEVKNIFGDEYIVLEEYLGSDVPLTIEHECGHQFKMVPYKLLHLKKHCPVCFGQSTTTMSLEKKIYDLVGDEYTLKSEYVDSQTKIDIRHNKCMKTFSVRKNDFVAGGRCPFCQQSKGEREVERVLGHYQDIITFKSEKTLKELGRLRFDFLLYMENVLVGAIEYDGIQHFQPMMHIGGEQALIRQRANDKKKDDYCRENDIYMIRIPYWTDCIEDYLHLEIDNMLYFFNINKEVNLTKINAGKQFEKDVETSAKSNKVFFYRIKDTSIPASFRATVRVTKNDYDCMMFANHHLFTLELKSTKDKSISFQESVIKQHQIDKLNEANAYEGVISGFIMNFREPENKVYFIHIEEFLKYQYIAQNQIKEHTYRSRVNKSSISLAICEEIGIEIKGYKPRTRWHYHLKDFIVEAINTYGDY